MPALRADSGTLTMPIATFPRRTADTTLMRWTESICDAGIFMSYVGLFSYYNFDNWAYQPSYVSSNTPWFFNGMRVQIFPN